MRPSKMSPEDPAFRSSFKASCLQCDRYADDTEPGAQMRWIEATPVCAPVEPRRTPVARPAEQPKLWSERQVLTARTQTLKATDAEQSPRSSERCGLSGFRVH